MLGATVSILVTLGVLAAAAIVLYQRLVQICPPNEVLILSGRGDRPRVIKGGRAMRLPLLEKVDRLDLTNMAINVTVKSAYAKGGIPLNVQGVANVKIAGVEPTINNAMERLLGKPRKEIMQLAQDTLEGNLRGVLATLTPEQVNEDKLKFGQSLLAEADVDLRRLGLMLDTLKIQNVWDDVGYLDSIGRVFSAEIVRQARVAEANAKAQAVKRDAENQEMSAIAEIEAQIDIARAKNTRRIADAVTVKAAMVSEEQAKVEALVARAKADLAVQEARIEQIRRKLEADVVAPAKARQRQLEQKAVADVAKVIEEGRATAGALNEITKTWKAAGPNAKDIFLMQKLEGLLKDVVSTIRDVKIDRINILPGGSGAANGSGSLATKAATTAAELRAALGVDIPDLLSKLSKRADPAT